MKIENLPELAMTSGQNFSIDILKDKWTVLYFYPKDSTPGCTNEGNDFNELFEQFRQLNAQILGVSRDKIVSHEKFKEKYEFKFDLVSDIDEKLCQYFDVIKEKTNYGKTYLGIERSTFLISPQLDVVQEWRKVRVKEHAATVLQFLKDLQS